MLSVKQAPIISGKTVLVRCDFDVPLKNGEIQNTFRIDMCLPTLKFLLGEGADLVLATKLGSPKGEYVEELSTKVIKPYLDKKLGFGNYTLLENLRFDSREKENSVEFAQELAQGVDFYVNECFATSHRTDTSIVGFKGVLPSFAGLRLVKEVETLSSILKSPARPLVSIIGGAKLESKKPAVDKFLKISDAVLVGGKIGLDWKETVPGNLFLPVDYAQDNLDIGPNTIKMFQDIIKDAKTIVWAGPLGYYEDTEYLTGTSKIAEAAVNSLAHVTVGGGDTTTAIEEAGFLNDIDFVSTGGGAMLEFLIKGTLPGIEALN